MNSEEASAARPYDLVVENRPLYLFARVKSETREYKVAIEYWKEIAAVCIAGGYRKLLVEKVNSPPLSIADAFDLGSQLPALGLLNVIVAIVDHAIESREVNAFAETVAKNRGMDGGIFGDVPTAERWLLAQ